jgi:GNAT superfamily N-acetyltransferase
MNQQFTCRQAVLADIDTLVVLFDQYRQFYKQRSDPQGARAFLLDRIRNAQSVLFLAHDGDTPLGFVQMYPSFESISLGRKFIFNDLYVTQEARKRGVGKALIDAAAGYARALGCNSLGLSTARDNHTAQALYRATGWELEETYIEFNLPLSVQPDPQP